MTATAAAAEAIAQRQLRARAGRGGRAPAGLVRVDRRSNSRCREAHPRSLAAWATGTSAKPDSSRLMASIASSTGRGETGVDGCVGAGAGEDGDSALLVCLPALRLLKKPLNIVHQSVYCRKGEKVTWRREKRVQMVVRPALRRAGRSAVRGCPGACYCLLPLQQIVEELGALAPAGTCIAVPTSRQTL